VLFSFVNLMSECFDEFKERNDLRIRSIADRLKDFEIDDRKIGAVVARSRVVQWLHNFAEIGIADLELPLLLLEKIEFLKLDDISDRLASVAGDYIKQSSAYIAPLGEAQESSFRITSRLNKKPNFRAALPLLLESVPDQGAYKILFFDDFLNSGGQLISIFYALLNKPLPDGETTDEADSRTKLNPAQIIKLKKAEIHLFYYQVFLEGTEKVVARLQKELGLKVYIHAYYPTNKNDGAFGDKNDQEMISAGSRGELWTRSIFHGMEYARIREFYLSLKAAGEALLREKEKSWEEAKYADRALGYGNLCRVIVTDSNIPTISLTALWQSGRIAINGKSFDWKELLPRTKKVLPPRTPTWPGNSEIETKCDEIAKELQVLYEDDRFVEGIEKAEEAFEKYGANIKILKHVLRFNMRNKNWQNITEIINGLNHDELSDAQKGLCGFMQFESGLREGYECRHNDVEFGKAVKELRKYLNHLPKSEKRTDQFFYLEGRWFLELWWANRLTNGASNLAQALSSFNKALQIKDTWWTQCYKCIVLKLQKNKDFEIEAKLFKERIFAFQQKKNLQPSVKIHCLMALIMLDEKEALKKYLKEFNQKISPTDFEDSLVHKIEIIYSSEKEKRAYYENMVRKWSGTLPRK